MQFVCLPRFFHFVCYRKCHKNKEKAKTAWHNMVVLQEKGRINQGLEQRM